MLPNGIIVIWSGAIVDIPAGWQICDGTNGTPNLQNRFVVGAGDTYAVGASDGNINHNHDFTGDGHSHGITGGANISGGAAWHNSTTTNPATGTTNNANGLPPYYALAYIQKIS